MMALFCPFFQAPQQWNRRRRRIAEAGGKLARALRVHEKKRQAGLLVWIWLETLGPAHERERRGSLGKERAAGCLGHETKPRPSLKEGKEAPG